MDYNFETTTLEPSLIEAASAETATLRLYDIFIPLLGIFIILLNSIVVNASGLLIEKRKSAFVISFAFATAFVFYFTLV